MDEVLVNTENFNSEFTKKIFDAIIYILLFAFAVIMMIVGVSHVVTASLFSGAFYFLIGIADIVLMALYRRGEL